MIRSPIVAPYDSTPARAASSPWCNSIVAPRTLVKNVAHGWREARRRAAKRLLGGGLVAIVTFATPARAQTPMSWPQVKAKFEATNPTLQADQLAVEETRASQITAFLRPNPQVSATLDQIGHNANGRPFDDALPLVLVGYLHERQQKRELRRDSARGATAIAVSGHADLERTLIFTLRSAFVQVLQAKAFFALAQDNLAAYDQALTISRDRFQSGDIAQIDLDRLELQRVQYESDVQTAQVNVRIAKIQLLRLLNDQTPIERFDVTGRYDFTPPVQTIEAVRRIALDTRPDLKAALAGIEKAKIDHRLALANGSTDPTITVDVGFPALSEVWQSYSPTLRQYAGVNVSMPLRLFDRNQGEKLRTQLDIARNERLGEAARLQIFSDVDSAYATLTTTVALLQPYKASYLDRATRVRDTVTFSYQRGGASLLDFLQAQQEYRSVQIGYVNLVAAYLSAAAQLNLATGQEVIP